MRKLILFTASMMMFSLSMSAWGPAGHTAVAFIAEDHLTPKAKKMLHEYLNGIPISAISTDADLYRGDWTFDMGFMPNNPEKARKIVASRFDNSLPANIAPWPHTFAVDRSRKPVRSHNIKGEYVENILFQVKRVSKLLIEEADTMDPEDRYRYIALIVHWLGDMHCPGHIEYRCTPRVKTHFNVIYNDREISYHRYWDGSLIGGFGWSASELARIADTATKSEFNQIVSGDIYDWAQQCSTDCWVAFEVVKSGDKIDDKFSISMRPLLLQQIRNGGYRLAAVLNDIFQ